MVVLTDLRGYGDSGKPAGGPTHDAYAKRTMAYDQVRVMRELGFESFAVVGHDRGARVAHRMALDYPRSVTKLAVLDIVPTRHALRTADKDFGLGYWHWFFLAQPEPLPEHQIGADPVGWVRGRMSTWRRGGQPFDPRAVDEYVRCFKDPAAIHASCEDYRAAVGTDLDDDDAAAARGQRVIAPLLALWGEHGFVGRHYGDVAAIWREYAEKVQGRSLPCGHFLAEEVPAGNRRRPAGFPQGLKCENMSIRTGACLRPPAPMTATARTPEMSGAKTAPRHSRKFHHIASRP